MNAEELHKSALVFDAHCDSILNVMRHDYEFCDRHTEHHVDIPRLKEGGIDVEGFAIWVDPRKYKEMQSIEVFKTLDLLEDQANKNPDDISIVTTADEARKTVSEGKIGMLIGLEGGHAIEDSLELVHQYYSRGIRYITLTWMFSNNWADSSTDKSRWGGLNPLGVSVVKEMNRIGMMVDLSHTSDETVLDVFEVSEKPVIMTHSCAKSLCDHPRNVSDDLLKKLAQNGGVMGVNFYLGYLVEELVKATEPLEKIYNKKKQKIIDKYGKNTEQTKTELKKLYDSGNKAWNSRPGLDSTCKIIVDHIDHVVNTAGIDHVGLGSDFDGISLLPVDLKDASEVPNITKELVARGYSETDIKKILGENFMRVFKEVCG